MRILGIDFETTGLDINNDRIIEAGLALYDTDTGLILDLQSLVFWDDSYPEITPFIEELTGTKSEYVKEFGNPIHMFPSYLEHYLSTHRVDYFCAHNARNFDLPMLLAEILRSTEIETTTKIKDIPWIDTKEDLPWDKEPESNKLKHLALDLEFINPLPHRALTDTLTMIKVLMKFDIQRVVENSKVPSIVVRADVSFNDRDKAKQRKYSWERVGDLTYPKCWVKRIKLNKLEQERKEAPFNVVQL